MASSTAVFTVLLTVLVLLVQSQMEEYAKSAEIASRFSKRLIDETAEKILDSASLLKKYDGNEVEIEEFSPDSILQEMRNNMNEFLQKKAKAVEKLVSSAEGSYQTYAHSALPDECGGKLDTLADQKCFYRYYAARCNSLYNMPMEINDSCVGCPYCADNRVVFAFNNCSNPTSTLNCQPNSRFHGKAVNISRSAVHIPTVIYERSPEMLTKIRWTDSDGGTYNPEIPGFFDKIAIANREKDSRLGWQFLCSTTGFLRVHPVDISQKRLAFAWHTDAVDQLDMYDCRLSPWYITASTYPKLMVILLDISGSMLGQRYEIAKQTVETILDTLTENDYVNIVLFKSKPVWINDCWQGKLLQATMRNKRILRAGLNVRQKEIDGIADYEAGFRAAFALLKDHNCTESYMFNGTKQENATSCFIEDLMDKVKFESEFKLNKDEEKSDRSRTVDTDSVWPCTQAIMLITDGASQNYENVFAELNPDRRVHVFSYVIGEEVTELKEVRYMACRNRGYFAHISNLADVQGKIHHYVERLSRTLAMYNDHTPMWTGIYFDRMYTETVVEEIPFTSKGGKSMRKMQKPVPRLSKGRTLVVSVAAPVYDTFGDPINHTLLGVVGTSIPLAELQRLAPSYLIGPHSYTYMVDYNGYVMFHPQFRPLFAYEIGGQTHEIPKPHYNSIDILDVESMPNELDNNSRALRRLDYNSNQKRKDLIMGKTSGSGKIRESVLFTLEDNKRVYRQSVTHYYTPVEKSNSKKTKNWENTSFSIPYSLGIGIVDSIGRTRIVIKSDFDRLVEALSENAINGNNWRVHPDWEYCEPEPDDVDRQFLIRTIFNESVLEDMKKPLPQRCRKNDFLMKNLLFDLYATCDVTECWIGKSTEDRESGVYVAFVATRSGLTRYVDLNMDDILTWDLPSTPAPITSTPASTTTTHANLGGENSTLHTTTPNPGVEDMRPKHIHFIDRHLRAVDELFYQRAIRAPEGIYVFDVISNNRVYEKTVNFNSTYGVVEEIHIPVTGTKAIYKTVGGKKAPLAVLGLELTYDGFATMLIKSAGDECKPRSNFTPDEPQPYFSTCYLLDDNGYIVFTNDIVKYSAPTKLKMYFGSLNPAIMWKLVENYIYERVGYMDYQAMCKHENLTSSAMRLVNPILSVAKLASWVVKEFAVGAIVAIFSILSSLISPTKGYTENFRFFDAGMSCDEHSSIYILNRTAFAGRNEVKMDFTYGCTGVQCGMEVTSCKQSVSASLVPKTNLILVVIRSKPECISHPSCISCSGTVHKNHSHLVKMAKQVAYAASDKAASVDLKYKDPKNIKAEHGAEVSDGTNPQVEVSTHEATPKPELCKIEPRRRNPAKRVCHWRYQNYTEDDTQLFMCSDAKRLELTVNYPVLFIIYGVISRLFN